jgi:hypothetical protein
MSSGDFSVRRASVVSTNYAKNSQQAVKARQAQKIEQLRQIFLTGGCIKRQADLLGLCRSTSYAILQRDYKHSGLTAGTIKRMLASPDLPVRARNIIHEYIAEKIAGLYGHSPAQRRRFITALVTDQDSNLERVETNGRSSCDRENLPMTSGLVQALRENCGYLRDEGLDNMAVLIERAADELDRLHQTSRELKPKAPL